MESEKLSLEQNKFRIQSTPKPSAVRNWWLLRFRTYYQLNT